MSYNASNVGVGKPRLTGSVFKAPIGTELPTDASTDLGSDFAEMGYSADDGLTNENSRESEEIKAWGGDTVASPLKSKTDKFKVKLIEVLNSDVLKAVYGDDNVTGDLTSGLAVAVGADDDEPAVWVFDMVIGSCLKRVVLPNAKITEMGEIVYRDDEVVGFEITLTALPDENRETHYEYMVKDEESA